MGTYLDLPGVFGNLDPHPADQENTSKFQDGSNPQIPQYSHGEAFSKISYPTNKYRSTQSKKSKTQEYRGGYPLFKQQQMQAQISCRIRTDKGGTLDANDLEFGEFRRGVRGF